MKQRANATLRWALTGTVLLLTALTFGCGTDSEGVNDGDNTQLDTGNQGDIDFLDVGEGDGSDATSDATPDTSSETLGGDCASDVDCAIQEICVGADPANQILGYCTFLDCESSAECDFGADDAAYCCSDFGEFRGCFREAADAVCGDETGGQSDDCGSGGQSDCQGDEFYCIDWYNDRICVAQCLVSDRSSCSDGSWCITFSGGNQGVCIPEGDTEEREACGDDPNGCEAGTVCDGAFQEETSPFAHCAELCTRDTDCENDEWCRIWPGQQSGTCLPLGDFEEGESCTENRWGCEEDLYCLNEGTQFARCTSLCERESDCEDGFRCDFFIDDLGTCQIEGDRESGEFCDDNPFVCVDGAFCVGGFGAGHNPDAYCAENCEENANICPNDFYCADLDEDGEWCLPDGDAGPGESCDSQLDCEAETYCTYSYEEWGQCAELCSGADDCGQDEWCTGSADQDGVCISAEGTIGAGESCDGDPFGCAEGSLCASDSVVCLPECTGAPESCPAGMYCTDDEDDEEARSYCAPFGSNPPGEACDDSSDCAPDTFCGFTGETGKGICTADCSPDEPCPDGFWCMQAAAFGLCLPDGELDAGESCEDASFDCGTDSFCLFRGTPEAYCATHCTGFPNRCDADDSCRYAGWGLSFCVGEGEGGPGDSCAGDVGNCDGDTVCIQTDEESAACHTLCTFNTSLCSEDDECFFYPSGIGVCGPPDFDPGELPLGGRPL